MKQLSSNLTALLVQHSSGNVEAEGSWLEFLDEYGTKSAVIQGDQLSSNWRRRWLRSENEG
jgi:hypothetical protein